MPSELRGTTISISDCVISTAFTAWNGSMIDGAEEGLVMRFFLSSSFPDAGTLLLDQ